MTGMCARQAGIFLRSAFVLRRGENGPVVAGLNYTVNGNNGPGQNATPTATDKFFWVKPEYEGTGVASVLRGQKGDEAIARDLQRDASLRDVVKEKGFLSFGEYDAFRRLSLADIFKKGTNPGGPHPSHVCEYGPRNRLAESFRHGISRAALSDDGEENKKMVILGGGGKYYGLVASQVIVKSFRTGTTARRSNWKISIPKHCRLISEMHGAPVTTRRKRL